MLQCRRSYITAPPPAAPTPPPPWHASGQNLEFWRVLTVDTAVWVVAEHNLRWLQWVSTFHIRVHDETVTSQLHYPGNLHMLGFGRAGGRFINDASLSSVREAGRREAPMALLFTATNFLLVVSMIWFSYTEILYIKMIWYHEKLIHNQHFLNNNYDIAAHAFSVCSCSSQPLSKISPIAKNDAGAILLSSSFLESKASGPIFRSFIYFLFIFEKMTKPGDWGRTKCLYNKDIS